MHNRQSQELFRKTTTVQKQYKKKKEFFKSFESAVAIITGPFQVCSTLLPEAQPYVEVRLRWMRSDAKQPKLDVIDTLRKA